MKSFVIAVGLALLVAAPAQADWRQDRAQLVADTVWHHPCGDRPVQIIWEPIAGADAQVHHDERPPYPTCAIHFNTRESWDWTLLCSYMIHEYGHLANFYDPLNPSDPAHSHNDDSIMAELFVNDDRCAFHGVPYLMSRGVLSPASSSWSRLSPGNAGRPGHRTRKLESPAARRRQRASSRAYRRETLRSEARALRRAKRSAR